MRGRISGQEQVVSDVVVIVVVCLLWLTKKNKLDILPRLSR